MINPFIDLAGGAPACGKINVDNFILIQGFSLGLDRPRLPDECVVGRWGGLTGSNRFLRTEFYMNFDKLSLRGFGDETEWAGGEWFRRIMEIKFDFVREIQGCGDGVG